MISLFVFLFLSLASGFKPRLGYIRRIFHLSLRLITIGGSSAHLAYFVHKNGRKTATFTFSFLGTVPCIGVFSCCGNGVVLVLVSKNK